MLQFKRIYVSPIGPDFSQKLETTIPENEQAELQVVFHPPAIGDEDVIKIEGHRGWCSWGF